MKFCCSRLVCGIGPSDPVWKVTDLNELGILLGCGENWESVHWWEVKDPAAPVEIPDGWQTL
jgi:hypothetical protein